MTSSTLDWSDARTGAESAKRDDLVQLGLWMFLATVAMLFAAFTSAYIIRRSGSDWVPIELPRLLWLNTAALAASSLALEVGRIASRRDESRVAGVALAMAVGLGVAFLAGQIAVWRTLVAQGVYVPTSPHSSFFYVLTATHGIHVVAGLMLLMYAAVRSRTRGSHRDGAANARLLTASATFWHFLAALWVYVFVLVSVF